MRSADPAAMSLRCNRPFRYFLNPFEPDASGREEDYSLLMQVVENYSRNFPR